MFVISLLVFGVLMALGAPIAFVMLCSAFAYLLMSPFPEVVVVQQLVTSLGAFPLLAVPFFVLAGSAMARGGLASRIMGLADVLVGHWRGGLGHVNVMNSVIMGGMSGSSIADAAIDSRILVPIMVRNGYGLGFSAALTASSAIIAPLLPPSIGLVIYGLIAQVSIGQLFIAGIVPGLVTAAGLMLTVSIISRRRGYGSHRTKRASLREILSKLRDAGWALGMPVLLIVGLRMGVFTPTELGAIAAVYALAVGLFVYRELKLSDLRQVLEESVLTTAVIMLLIGTAGAFNFILTAEQVPQAVFEALTGLSDNRYVLLTVIIAVFLALGTVMESTGLLIILTPILVPAVVKLGVSPVQFGVVSVMAVTIGALTPPVGALLFTVSSITGVKLSTFTRELTPFLVVIVIVTFVVAFIPALSLSLPSIVFP
jgi:tripartite ATP-independent transporter DctM subunit